MKYFNETDLNLLKDPRYLEEFLQQYRSSLHQFYTQHQHDSVTPQEIEHVFLRNKNELFK